ncbi:MAG: hypothetical protein IPL48_03940 [Bacteroidetes bacterium]|nr:hypothetical protein [Bacteroidota bacterium]
MEYFSVNAFYLGMLFFACLFISNVLYSLICLIWKIKIVEFGLFANAWFALYKEKILGTEFILGWLPFSSHIRPLGMSADEEDKAKIHQDDLPFAFFNKPKYLQKIFRFVPWIIYISAALISIVILSTSSFSTEVAKIANYTAEAFRTMFSDSNTARQEFVKTTKEIIDGKNVVLFAFAMLVLAMLLLTPVTLIMNWFSSEAKKSKLQKTFGFATTIFILWFIVWKIPKFVFSFFPASQDFIYFFSFLIGMFATGFLCFFTTLYVVKGVSKNLSESKTQWQKK